MMGSKHRNYTAKAVLVIWILFPFEFMESATETCEKIDDCSCKKGNGKIINLREIDGGSKGPAVKRIATVDPPGLTYKFDWNPCTKFNEGDCKNMLVCQTKPGSTETYPCAETVSHFEVNGDGTTTIVYQEVIDSTGYKRVFKINLKCDAAIKNPGESDGVKENQVALKDSIYTMAFKSKCACDDGCVSNNPLGPAESTRLSTGSILLIVFFVLIFVYLIGGIVIKKYKMGVESMPEMVPNYEFWAGIPSLVKDGVVFSCTGLKSCCSSLYSKCSKDGYAKI